MCEHSIAVQERTACAHTKQVSHISLLSPTQLNAVPQLEGCECLVPQEALPAITAGSSLMSFHCILLQQIINRQSYQAVDKEGSRQVERLVNDEAKPIMAFSWHENGKCETQRQIHSLVTMVTTECATVPHPNSPTHTIHWHEHCSSATSFTSAQQHTLHDAETLLWMHMITRRTHAGTLAHCVADSSSAQGSGTTTTCSNFEQKEWFHTQIRSVCVSVLLPHGFTQPRALAALLQQLFH